MSLSELNETQRSELFVTYASLVLADDNAPITEENINKLITAAGGSVEKYWPKLFANMLAEQDVNEILLKGGGGPAPVAAAAATAGGDGSGSGSGSSSSSSSASSSGEGMGMGLFD